MQALLRLLTLLLNLLVSIIVDCSKAGPRIVTANVKTNMISYTIMQGLKGGG